MTISHVFPGVHWGTVWDLPVSVWRAYAAAADQWTAEQAKGANHG